MDYQTTTSMDIMLTIAVYHAIKMHMIMKTLNVYLHGFDVLTAFRICKLLVYIYVSMNFLSPLICQNRQTEKHDSLVTDVPRYIDGQLNTIATSNTLDHVCKQAKRPRWTDNLLRQSSHNLLFSLCVTKGKARDIYVV